MNDTKCLNSLKGFAACIVAFVWHYQHFAPQAGSPLYSLFTVSYRYGWLMVELFFMLSGFGMMLGYAHKIMSHAISFKDYMLRRLKKIYPLFFLSLILVTVLEWLYKQKTGDTFVYSNFDVYHFVLNLLCLQNGFLGTEWSFNSPSWCISICLGMYALFYVIVYFSKSKSAVFCKFACLALMGAGVLLSGISYPVFNSLMARGVVCFSIGVIISEIYTSRNSFNSKKLGYIFGIVIMMVYWMLRTEKYTAVGNVQMLFIVGLAPMLILCVLFVPWLNRVLSFSGFLWLGSISVAIYLLHFPIQCLIKLTDIYFLDGNLNYSTKVTWLSYALLTIGVSALYKSLLENDYSKWFSSLLSKTN